MAIINVDDAYILNETGAQVDKTTGIPFKDESLTEAEAAQARANIRAGGTNPNLLDNPWFTVNQRGWTSGTANAAFTVDRWKMSSAYGTKQVTVNADGTITFNGLFFQKIEPHFIAGQVVTISYMTADGNVVSKTGTIGTTEGYAVGNASFGLYYRPSTGVCDFQIQADGLTLRACKVELGSVSTLANDAPPNYAEELAKCQRYCVALNPYNHPYAKFGIGYPTSTTGVEILASLTVPLRAQPTITYSGNIVVKDYKDITNKTFTSLSVGWQTSNSYVVLTASGISGLTLGSPLVLQANNDSSAQIILSADL